MARVPEIFGFKRKGDGPSSSRTLADKTPKSAHAPDPDYEAGEDFEGTKTQLLEYIFDKFKSIDGIPPIDKIKKAQLQIIAKAATLEEGLREIRRMN